MNFVAKYTTLGVFLLVFLCPIACRKQIIVTEDEITNDNRASMGKIIENAIKANPTTFPLVSPSENIQAYRFLDSLYSLAINGMRLEGGSNSWSKERVWKFNIILDDRVMAFCLPGGDFYITKGFLEQYIETEHELFYIMTFEAVIMDENYLLRELIEVAGNPTWLIEIVNNGESSTGTTALDLANAIFEEIQYDEIDVLKIDESTVNSICIQSSYKRTGILNIIEENNLWRSLRPSYTNRDTMIIQDTFIRAEVQIDCGNNSTTPFLRSDTLKNTIRDMKWE